MIISKITHSLFGYFWSFEKTKSTQKTKEPKAMSLLLEDQVSFQKLKKTHQ